MSCGSGCCAVRSTEREYWAQRAAEFGAAVGETWDTRALMDRFYAAA